MNNDSLWINGYTGAIVTGSEYSAVMKLLSILYKLEILGYDDVMRIALSYKMFIV